jgi:SAM-dependent methyltransferase
LVPIVPALPRGLSLKAAGRAASSCDDIFPRRGPFRALPRSAALGDRCVWLSASTHLRWHTPSSSTGPVGDERLARLDRPLGFYVEEATKVKGKVLELMCGTERISLPLLEVGVDLTCVDASEGMLARLEERLHARKLDARVLRADVRRLNLGEEEFNLPLVPFHSFSELVSPRDRELALRAVHGCLREGGRLVCPLHNPAIRARSADGALRLNGSFPTADGGLLVVSGFETLDEGSGVVDRLQLYEFFDASSELRAKRALPMRFALIDRSGFAELADGAGCGPVALDGDYNRGEYLEASSPFMVWVLERAKRP